MERIQRNKIHIIAYSTLTAALIASIIWLAITSNRNRQLANEINNDYNRAFSELTGYVDGIESNLRKSMLVSGPAQLASLSNDIFRQSTAAKSSLGTLPVTEINLENTAKFLSQVGDYTYVLSQNAINGKNISEEDFKNLASLTSYAADLNKSLSDTLGRIYSGEVSLSPQNRSMNTVIAASDIITDMENVEKSFEEYPSLIYDGPFSEHIENRESAMLKNAQEISMEDAKKVAESFLGEKGRNLNFESDTQNTPIDAYTFTSRDDNSNVSISITKRGGHVLYFLNNRDVFEENLNFSDCISIGEKFLKDIGYKSLTNSYYDKNSHVATVNFAYIQDGTTCYSDLIKVKIALDNGEILGLEANGYLMNHEIRQIPAPSLSASQARAKVSPHLNVDASGLTLIPKDSLQEVLCYEFHGNFDGRNYLIYINAQNGREEKILMLIESEDGILTE